MRLSKGALPPLVKTAWSRWGDLVVILALSTALMAMRWAKLDALTFSDPSMWLWQIGRFARGEMPYRDFSWNYPPLSILVLGGIARVFGPTFGVLQAAMDVLSLAVVLLCYSIARFLLPKSLHLVTIFAVIAICATTLTKFNLFSFSSYSPSLHFAAIGLLLVLVGGLRQLKRSAKHWSDFALITAGAFLAATSKPEAMVAAWGAVLLLCALRWKFSSGWVLYCAALLAAAVLPALAMYGIVALLVGVEPLALGVSGYGLASFACPWWPTGLGLFGAGAVTGEAGFLAAALLWVFRRNLRAEWRGFARALWFAAVPGLLLFVAYILYLDAEPLRSSSPLSFKLERVVVSVAWTSPILLPVMWAAIWLCLYWTLLIRRLSVASAQLYLFLSVPVIMSVRSLFGTTLFPITEVSAMCYPFLIVAAACLLWALFEMTTPEQRRVQTLIVIATLGVYSLARLTAAYPDQLSNSSYYALDTEAGQVNLSDAGKSGEIYQYIVEHTGPSDNLMDLPYGGGFNFASRRPSPTFTTQFRQLRMPSKLQERDLRQFIERKPKLVIARNDAHYGAFWGHAMNMNCTFPHFQWAPTEPSWDPAYVFPVVRYIEENYTVAERIGDELILRQ